MIKRILVLLAICSIVSAITGCGYTTRSMISSKYKTIYITPFVNKIDWTNESAVANKYKIYRPLLETEITKSVIDKYIFDGNLRLGEIKSADLTLKGELVEFRRDPLRYTDTDTILEYRLNIVVNLELWDKRENKIVWQEQRFTGDTTYFTTGLQSISEDTAVTIGIKDLARRIVERTVEQW